MKIRLALLTVAIGLSACTSNPDIGKLSMSQLEKYRAMEAVEGTVAEPHFILGRVKGLSCHRNGHEKKLVTPHEAIEGTKLRAALLDADSVINLICRQNRGTDWANNCWGSIVCFGDAIRYR